MSICVINGKILDNVGDTFVVHNVRGDNEAVDNEDQQDEVQRAIYEQVFASQKKKLDKGKRKCIQLRKRMYKFKSGGAEVQEPNQNEQNPPSQDKGFATPLRMFDMGISDTVKEHEQDMDILMRRIKAKGNNLKDPFHFVHKTERYPLYGEATHWKLKKPKVIGKCGQRKEVIKDPSKGKQRAYKKFPTKDPNEASSHSIGPWRCYAKKLKVDGSFQVISLKDEHACVKIFKYGTLINYKCLGKHFGDKVRANEKITLHALADLVMKKYSCIFTPNQCRRVKDYALSEGECSLQDHYGMLWSYAKAILDSNEGSIVKVGVTVNPDEKTYIDRFYVCLHGLKEGWKLGCRKIIALDGCFLKKPNSREILTAVGRDGNNQIYHMAWAIMNVKNKENWCWFLSLLGKDLEFPDGSGLTLISDQHKGLIEAVKQVMPYAEHKQCARHIYEGFRKEFSGIKFRLLFWAASKDSYPQLFTKIVEKIKKANPKAHEYLSKKDKKSWSRAFFREGINCEAVDNGFSECFNVVLVSLRHKPIITMLESMRVLVMERMHTMRLIMKKWRGEICPKIQAILEHTKDQQRFWHVIPAGNSKFEVRKGYDAFTVDEAANTCSCRMW
ncbi:pentatricopeptide repeat-containing protein [Tanacetum coccineum]